MATEFLPAGRLAVLDFLRVTEEMLRSRDAFFPARVDPNSDVVIDNDGVQMMIDPMSFPYLMGSIVDYKEDLQGSRFVIDNPNAKTTCGCGSSFSI